MPVHATSRLLTSAAHWRDDANAIAEQRRLVNHQGMPIVFVEQSELPRGIAYETFISNTGRVPTRVNLHDFFNALVWLTYPLAKARLNAVQATEIARLSTRSTIPQASLQSGRTVAPVLAPEVGASGRGALRDRATVFDENAALLITSETAIETALRDHQWRQALVMQRDRFGTDCEVRLFGHALMEKLVAPYKAITGHVWVVQVEREFFSLDEPEKRDIVDALLSQALQQGLLNIPAMALPVLGVPGWWHLQDHGFYDDPSVFRPKRSVKVRATP